MPCISCGRGFHDECHDCQTCHGIIEDQVNNLATVGNAYQPRQGSRELPDHLVTDIYSTGRKRAARDFPLNRMAPCEWRGLKNVGGGMPIVGCVNGYQQDRHHGPDKTTTNNDPSNVHRICKKCHKRWHYTNDAVYDQQSWSETKHEPEEATEEELKEYERRWIATARGSFRKVEED